ncbi:16S rRNA (cytosine(1402)-N(4))-methyltransferase RsmH, partial [Candidatus Aerophobetes bacterium]|nr:16S rRNA (cytosine(1402)-N(4))-methyltransferase RsmH [Candidatus Aerophobetes bacterium]
MKDFFHIPVMVKEVLYYLSPREGGIYVDCTVGTGGHSLAILQKTGGKVKLVGIDWDEEILRIASRRLEPYRESVILMQENFAEIDSVLKKYDLGKVDGFLYDLGVCQVHFDDFSRGFSFREDAPLDMRMDRRKDITAAHLVNSLSKRELEEVFLKLGEERWARRIAEFVVEERKKRPIETTGQLVEVLRKAIPAKFRRGRRLHFATKVFQALRIAVNQELENLKISLSKAIPLLGEGGRICVISYHSLEDRIVKQKFKQMEGKGLSLLTRR